MAKITKELIISSENRLDEVKIRFTEILNESMFDINQLNQKDFIRLELKSVDMECYKAAKIFKNLQKC